MFDCDIAGLVREPDALALKTNFNACGRESGFDIKFAELLEVAEH
ncbi:MAG TPA: hypothetical protein VI685_19695 [Candidatus Angelobacter sp.]